MKRNAGFKLVITAMFAAMTCVCTLLQVPAPVAGNINLGDALVLMCAFLLGCPHGVAAAAVGSALADLLSGYAFYAPGTLVIKAATALVAALVMGRAHGASGCTLRRIIAGLAAEAVMVIGYLFYAWFFLSYGSAAIASIPGNLVQAAAGILISIVLTPLVSRPREIREMLEIFRNKESE